jgi:hypothetical protein
MTDRRIPKTLRINSGTTTLIVSVGPRIAAQADKAPVLILILSNPHQ